MRVCPSALVFALLGCGTSRAVVIESRSLEVPLDGRAPPPLHVVMSASRALTFCVQRTDEEAFCVQRGEAFRRVVTTGPVVDIEPETLFVSGLELADVGGRSSPTPFPFEEVATLTLDVHCGRAADGRVACDSFAQPGVFDAVSIDGAPIAAASITASSDTLLALLPDQRLACAGRSCERIRAEREGAGRTASEGSSYATGTPWPSSPIGAATVIADGIAEVRTDGLGMVCLLSGDVRCHAPGMPSTAIVPTGLVDFACAANVLALLETTHEGTGVRAFYVGVDPSEQIWEADATGASHLHAAGTTLCVEAEGRLSCTEFRGRMPPAALTPMSPPGW